MTSTNDGKDVKSNQISGLKSKSYFIELYKSLEARLSGECSGEERARLVCESWRRVHSLCQHSAPTTQLHLLNWLQQHTARTILQTEWQSPKSKEQHTWLEQAIDEFIQECQHAISKRDGGWSPPWETQLQLRALWFKSTLANPWGHSVLKALLDSRGPQPSDDEVLEWLKLERGGMFVTRLRQLAASKCDDLALLLASAVMDRVRAATVVMSDIEQAEARENTEQSIKEPNFVKILRKEAGFTEDVWKLITDIEFVLLFKGEFRSRCIELAKQTPLRNGYQLVKRLHSRLESSPREKKLWKNAKDAATLVAQVVIARCMVVPTCAGAARGALVGCGRSLVRLLPPARLPAAAAALAAPAATSRHLHALAEAVHSQCKNDRTSFVCELYVRAITAGMNELERLKIKTEKESEARSTEQTLSTWFSQLGELLSASKRLNSECILTAFSVHPSAAMYERVKAAPILAPLQSVIQESKEEANSEYGSWATDSRTQTNFVKTSETLNLKKTQKQANVLSTAIFAEGEALGLGAELCQDLAVLISGPRVKTLSWDTDREQLLASCRAYTERTGGGTRALTTELRYLNLDPRCFQHLPEEPEDDGDLYYGIEKGYEHLVEFQEGPEEIWKDAASDDAGKSDSASTDTPLAVHRRKKTKTKRIQYSSDEDSCPLSLEAMKLNVKKERPHSKERSKERKEKKDKTKDIKEEKEETGDVREETGDIKQESSIQKKKERKKKDKDTQLKPINRPSGSLSRLVGMKVAGFSNLNRNLERRNGSEGNINMCITDSDYDSQGKSSIASLNSVGNDPDVLFDGLFSMEDIKSPEKNLNEDIQRANSSKTNESNVSQDVSNKIGKMQPTNYTIPLASPNVSNVREEVKNSIKKLIEFRRYKTVNEIRTDVQNQRHLSPQTMSIPTAHNFQSVAVSNKPQVFIPKEQIKKLNDIKDEVNNILQKTTFNKDKIGLNEAAEKLISPNTLMNRPNDKAKKSAPRGSGLKKIEEPFIRMDPMSIINRQGLLLEKAGKKAVQSKSTRDRIQHQNIIKHLEASVTKPLIKQTVESPSQLQFQEFLKSTMPSNRPRQVVEKSEGIIYHNVPQHISNTSSSLVHTNIDNKDKIIEQNAQQHISSKPAVNLSRLMTHKNESPSQQQFHNFLKDLQVSINAGASNDKHETKVLSTQSCSKQMIQKKPDNVPNTFARMSYLKNKQCDHKSKPITDKTVTNKYLQGMQIENPQHLKTKGDILISKIDKNNHQTLKEKEKIQLEKSDNKPKIKTEIVEHKTHVSSATPLRVVKNCSTMSNVLSSASQKCIPSILGPSELECNEVMKPPTPEITSFLSQKDQDDMLLLLRQKSLLNSMKGQHKTDSPKSAVDNITTLNNKTPLTIHTDRRPSINANNLKTNCALTPEQKKTNDKPATSTVLKNSKLAQSPQSKKVRNTKETNRSTKIAAQNSDWESVMDALLAAKTPSRVSQSGPNALDIALNKDSFERCYTSNLNNQSQKKVNSSGVPETIKNNPAIQKKSINKIDAPATKSANKCELKYNDKERTGSRKSQAIIKTATATKSVQKPQQFCIQNLVDLSKRDSSHCQGNPLPSVIQNRNDPFISGIKNSDYDLLEELMDDDLRQEIRELSDEEPYNISMSNTTKFKDMAHTSDITKKLNPVLNKNIYIHPQRNADPFENTYKLTNPLRCNIYKPVIQGKKCTSSTNNSESNLRIISNEVVVAPGNVNTNINYYSVINNSASAIRECSEMKNNCNISPKNTNICVSNKVNPPVINPSRNTAESTVKVDAQTRNMNNNNVPKSHYNILDPTRVVLNVPPGNTAPNVMLISNDFIYDPYSTIQVEQPNVNVNRNVSNYNNNTCIAVNQVPNVAVYHATAFTSPVVNPVLIDNPIVVPVSRNTPAAKPSQFMSTSTTRKENVDINKSMSELSPHVNVNLDLRPSFVKKDNDQNSQKIGGHVDKDKDGHSEFNTSLKSPCFKDNTCIAKKDENFNTNIPTSDILSSNTATFISSQISGEKLPKSDISNAYPLQDKVTVKEIRLDNIIQNEKPEINKKTDSHVLQHDIVENQSKLTNEQLNNDRRDRIYQKRLRILNREIVHHYNEKAIPLSYEPIKTKRSVTENQEIKNGFHDQTIKSKHSEIPKPSCRRILLRSSNTLQATKTQKSEIPKGKSSGLRKTKSKTKNKTKNSSKNDKNEIIQSKTVTVANETCDIKNENVISNLMPPVEEVENIGKLPTKNELNSVPNNNGHENNHFDSYMDVDVEENIESSVIPVTKIRKSQAKASESEINHINQDAIEENYIDERKIDGPLENVVNRTTQEPDFLGVSSEETNSNVAAKEITNISMNNLVSNNGKSNKNVTKEINNIPINNRVSCKSKSINNSKELETNKSPLNNEVLCNSNEDNKSHDIIKNIDKTQQIRDEFKDKIVFEELPNLDGDQTKRYIRIKLPNGSFKATISGKVNVNIDSILEDPAIKSMLWKKMNTNTKCILNIKQIAVQSIDRPSIIKTQIEDVSYVAKEEPETINLISDDDEDFLPRSFKTEFGSFKIASMDGDIFAKHQRKLSQRCEVKIQRCEKLNQIKINDVPKENDTNVLKPVRNKNATISDKSENIVDLIEIDDSSNESAKLVSTLNSTTVEDYLVAPKLDENIKISKNLVIKDMKSNNNAQTIKKQDLEIVKVKHTDIRKSSEKNKMHGFELRECSLKIEKCDKLVKNYEQMKVKNTKCFVNLVRCDTAQYNQNKKAEGCSEFKLRDGSNRNIEVLNVDEELNNICEQSLKRIDSVSILNDLPISDNDLSRVSPSVIENFNIYNTLTEDTKYTLSKKKLETNFLPHCCADWLMTKSNNRDVQAECFKLLNFNSAVAVASIVPPDDISTDCDSDRESIAESEMTYEEVNYEKDKNTPQVDKLVQITLDIFANNIHILESLKPTVHINCRKVLNSPLLKRKLNCTDDKTRNKISKLEETTSSSSEKIKGLITEQVFKTSIFPNNNVLSLQNICCSYVNAKIRCLHEEITTYPTNNSDMKEDLSKGANEDNNLAMCNERNKNNDSSKGVGSLNPLESSIEKIDEEKQTRSIYMNAYECHMEQVEKLDEACTTFLKNNEHSVTKLRDECIEDIICDQNREESHVILNDTESVFGNRNNANDNKNIIENCDENENNNIETFNRSVILSCKEHTSILNKTFEANLGGEKLISDRSIGSPSSAKNDFSVETDEDNPTTPDANEDDKNDGENNKYEDSSTEALLERSLDEHISNSYDNLPKDDSNDKLKMGKNNTNKLENEIPLYKDIQKQHFMVSDIPKSNVDNSKVDLSPDDTLRAYYKHSSLETNVKDLKSCQNKSFLISEDSNSVEENERKKSLVNEIQQMKHNEIEVAVILEEINNEPISHNYIGKSEILDSVSVVDVTSDVSGDYQNERTQKVNINNYILNLDKNINSTCLQKVDDIIYNKEECTKKYPKDLKNKQDVISNETKGEICFEDHKYFNSYENIHDKNICNQREKSKGIKSPSLCVEDNLGPYDTDIILPSEKLKWVDKSVTLSVDSEKPVNITEHIKNKNLLKNVIATGNFKSEINSLQILNYKNSKCNMDSIDLKSNEIASNMYKKENYNEVDISNKNLPNPKINCKVSKKELSSTLTLEKNYRDEMEQISEMADLRIGTNIQFSENSKFETKPSPVNDLNKTDCTQKHVSGKLGEITSEKVNINRAANLENILNDKPKQKNVTLVYKGDSQVVLEGSIYEDPVVGTCYVFPIVNRASITEEKSSVYNIADAKSISVINHLKNKVLENRQKKENEIKDEDFNFTVLPKITYLRERSKDNDVNDQTVNNIKRNLKRKIDTSDKPSRAKYRKGKNIDYPKFKIASINDSTYRKQYNHLFDYCSSVTFSYSRPFHIEHIDVCNLLKSWPIRGITVDNTVQTDFKNLLFIDEDVYKNPFDPLQQTFAEEISHCNDRQYISSNIIENNFSMGFGEESDRVIRISEVGESISKFSAATLSDVKQAQPFVKSKDNETKKEKISAADPCFKDNNVLKRYLTYIQLKEKVRAFFQNTALELNNSWLQDEKESNKNNIKKRFPYELTSLEYIKPAPFECVVQVVQVGQLPVSAAAQNPVTCDPRVTQVTDASPSQCLAENSPQDDSQPTIKTEYTELTTADISLPMVQEYQRHIVTQESSEAAVSLENIPVETEIKTEIKDEIPDFEYDENNCDESNVLQSLVNKHINNVEYPYDSPDNSNILHTAAASEVMYEQEVHNNCDFIPDLDQHNNSPEKTDQIAHAMNAAGITTIKEVTPDSGGAVNAMPQNICEEVANDAPPSPNNFTKTTINSITLQQALAQILPPPLNPTTQENNPSSTNSSLASQVLHIVQGTKTNGNQITVVDNSQNSVISNCNAPVLHIVQNKGTHASSTSNSVSGQHTNSFGGLSLVDSGLQPGSNQLLHIVNTGTQKNNTTGQLLKRVNLLTNLTNTQGSNEQKMVQFVCKSADGKSIQLNGPHQRSMVLRLQPIESNVQNSPKHSQDNQDLSPTSNGNNSTPVKEGVNNQHEIKSRSVYEENYAKFIQSSNKTVPEKSTTLPKFNQAFGKPVFQEDNQKTNDLNSNNSHLSSMNSSAESPECRTPENSMNIDHIGQISSPPLLLRKSPAQTSQAQPNLVQQIKQTITPMNIQTMHGGVIYTRQIPVNIGGGQTINLITVPSTELMDNDNQKQQGEVKFINQSDIESPIIKIVPHGHNNSEGTTDETNNHIGVSNESGQSAQSQHQPVLTQMRIKLPMLSKTPQMVSGARVVRPSFFQIQRNVIGGANQPVYQQLVLTAAPPLSQHIRLPHAQTNRQIKVTSEGQSSSETQMSTSTLEQLREFDMVLEQVKERSTTTPNTINAFTKLQGSSDTSDNSSVTSTVTESTQQVLYSIGNNQSLNVAYVNRKPNTTFVRSPDSSGIIDSPSSSTHIQIPHTVTRESTSNNVSAQPSQPKAAKVGSKSKSRPKSHTAMKINAVPPKTSSQKPLEDEQTTQRILYILAEYKEQVENSPDKDKPAPRRRSNPPSNPGSSKRKKSSSGSRRPGMRDMSPVLGEDTCRTMGSEDSSCGTSQGDCNESCMDSHSPQDSPRKVVRKLTFDNEATTPTQPRPQPQRNVIVADGQTITVARGTSCKPTTAVLMPANYILPVSMVKGGQQIAIVTNRGPKILTVGGGEGTTNALLLQRLIGPAGLKPVLTRPGVRHVRLPAAALHNIQAFNLATATVQPPDSTASPAHGSTPPQLIETRVTSSPWADRDTHEVKPERDSSPEDTEPWNMPTSADPHDYSYEETVRTENMDRTVLVVQRRDGSRHHRFAHVAHAAAMRHKYAILEHELRLQGTIFSQKSLSEECEDLGVDSPSASELFPEAELLFGNSPAHEAQQHSHTPQPTVLSQCGIPQPDIDDQIATDHILQHEVLDDQQDLGVTLGLDEGIVTVSEDGMQATIALDQEEFARSHPNTTFHSEPPEEGEIQPFTIAGLKGRHITSTIFHAGRAPATVLVSAPPTVIAGPAPPAPPTVLVRDDARAKFDLLQDTRHLHLSNTASAIVHSTGNATQVIRRVCWDERRDARFLIDEPEGLIAGDDAKMVAEDTSRDATMESVQGDVDDGDSTPERHAELFWESNSTSERSESRRPLEFSSDSEKCCKSPSYDETNSTDSSGVGAHMRLDSVIKDARGIEMSGSADGSSVDDAHPPVRTYPAKRMYHSLEGEMERSMSGKTRAGERSPDILEVRRRASGRGVVKRGCHCCNGSPAPLRPKKSRQRKPNMDLPSN